MGFFSLYYDSKAASSALHQTAQDLQAKAYAKWVAQSCRQRKNSSSSISGSDAVREKSQSSNHNTSPALTT
jgi:hypothetical protein